MFCFVVPGPYQDPLTGQAPGLGQGIRDCHNQSCGGDGVRRDAGIFHAVLFAPVSRDRLQHRREVRLVFQVGFLSSVQARGMGPEVEKTHAVEKATGFICLSGGSDPLHFSRIFGFMKRA